MSIGGRNHHRHTHDHAHDQRHAHDHGHVHDQHHAHDHDHHHDHVAELELDGIGRRDFLGLMSASLALAGVTLGGCIRKPRETILPFNKRPEDLVPGKPRYYATATQLTGSVVGLLVESQDGRPTKIEGNPRHPLSMGGTDAVTQASVLDLYDQARLRRSRVGKSEVSAAQRDAALAERVAKLQQSNGTGLAVLIQRVCSPTMQTLLRDLRGRYPRAKVYAHDASYPTQTLAGSTIVSGTALRPLYDLEQADRVVAFDADLLAAEGDALRNARFFARRRRMKSSSDQLNRLYVVEPAFSVTGMNADHRLRVAPSQVGEVMAELVVAVARRAPDAVAGLEGAAAVIERLGQRASQAQHGRWVDAVAEDLLAHRGRSLVAVGERQPPRVHGLAHLLNALLGNVGKTVTLYPDQHDGADSLAQLAAEIRAGKVETLVILGGNPVFDAPADLGFGGLLSRVATTIHLSPIDNETSRAASWVIPQSHYLEAWGDLRATDGTFSIQQPLIAPLFDSLSPIELLARLLALNPNDGYELVRRQWTLTMAHAAEGVTSEMLWRRTLHDGVRAMPLEPVAPTYRWAALAASFSDTPPALPTPKQLEVLFQLDSKLHDGRFGSNAWLQELPDPVTKLTWDNAAIIGVATARRLGLATKNIVALKLDGRQLELPVWVNPGVADNCIVLPLGYGQSAGGEVASGRGFNTYALRSSAQPHFAAGARVTLRRGSYELACTQQHDSMTEPDLPGRKGRKRPVAMAATLAEYRKNAHFALGGQTLPDHEIKTLLWTPPNETEGHQWGMSIDLGTCIGCNACTVACQAENNIPVVGKERVLKGREMHWIRLDRYFDGDNEDDPEVMTQPMACQHCETAPCESVCPVAATAHSPEGLNDMAYNRCIGTRYCSNNCPYKVRRFNFFNYQQERNEQNDLLAMQRNPDVTVRFRGVMEKCTYCVQRINGAKIEGKVEGTDAIADGTIIPACQQACPTEAIVFGDLNDPQSRVRKLKQLDRNYGVLADMNTQPRTTYLARVRNPNPKLA